MIRVCVVHALPERQQVIELEVGEGTTLRQAVDLSGIRVEFPARFGVFGRVRDPDECVADGDRIEIYRALLIDPKQARRARAAQKN